MNTLARDLHRGVAPEQMMLAAGLVPDAWQLDALRSTSRRRLWCCSRQSGKSTVAAAIALHRATYQPRALVLLASPSLRQSAELFRKVAALHRDLEMPAPDAESVMRLELPNKSRIIALPGSAATTRGFSAPDALIVDEAAHVEDAFIQAILPAIASNPDAVLMMLSTPNGRRGAFYEAWLEDSETWEKTQVRWRDCPRITQEAVDLYRNVAGETLYRQEFETEFLDSDTQMFSSELVEAAVDPELSPLWL